MCNWLKNHNKLTALKMPSSNTKAMNFKISLIMEDIFQIQVPGCLYSEGLIIGGIFCVSDLGGFYMEGVMHGGAYFQNFTVLCE